MDICMSKFMDIVQLQKGTPRLTKRGILSIIFHLILFIFMHSIQIFIHWREKLWI